MYHPLALPSSLRIAQRTRAHFTPKHWLLSNLKLYYFEFEFKIFVIQRDWAHAPA
jgi:hypothetical protein